MVLELSLTEIPAGCSALRRRGSGIIFRGELAQRAPRVLINDLARQLADVRCLRSQILWRRRWHSVSLARHCPKAQAAEAAAILILTMNWDTRTVPLPQLGMEASAMPAPVLVVHNEFDTPELALVSLRAAGREAIGFENPMTALDAIEAEFACPRAGDRRGFRAGHAEWRCARPHGQVQAAGPSGRLRRILGGSSPYGEGG